MNAKEKVQVEDLIQEVKVLKTHLSKRLVKMEGHLYDDKETNQEGLIHQVKDLDKKVDEILWEIKWAKWVVTAIVGAISFGFNWVYKFIFG